MKRKAMLAGAALLLALLLLSVSVNTVAMAILSIIGGEESRPGDVSLDGLPPFITVEMVEALLEMQDLYGQPASTGLAQLIVESGFGRYGPGGEDGKGLSGLAYDHKNLFGIKWSPRDTYATGSYNYSTGEQTPTGGDYTIVAGFAIYPSYTDCIKRRAGLLENAPYIDKVQSYKKTGGIYTQEQANGFMAGIRAAGWATSISYVDHCTSVMRDYNLYRFDNMSLEEFRSSQAAGGGAEAEGGQEYQSATAAQKHIVDTAYETPFAGNGLCAAWVSRVFRNAGQPYPGGNANSYNMTRASGGLKVGMVICVQHSPYGSDGWAYGHIGIYLGDGKVMHNESSRTGNASNGCTITDLDTWKANYEHQCTAYYGWANGIDLS